MARKQVPGPTDPTTHLPWLMGRLLKEVSAAVAAARVDGLRTSHLRLLAVVPADGATISELSGLVGMTKQACGQVVSHLAATGHVRVDTDPADRRSRRVVRSPAGDAAAARLAEVMTGVEADWERRLGPGRWAQLQAALTALSES